MPLDKQNFNYSIPLSAPLLSADNGVIVGDTTASQTISNGKILYSLNSTTYIPVGISTVVANSVAYQATAPINPSVGQLWVDSSSSNTSFDPNIIRRKTIVATGGQTVFTTDLAFTDGYEQVFVNGALIVKNTDYTTTNSITITLVKPAANNDIVEILSVTNLNSVSGSTATTTTNTFTGAQTFTPSNAAITPITINGAFNQSADLLDVKNYSGTTLIKINSSGNLVSNYNVGIGTSATGATLALQSFGDRQIDFVNPTGSTVAYIGTTGAIGSAPTDSLRIRSDFGGIIFGYQGFEQARINSTGHLLIGKTSDDGYNRFQTAENFGLAGVASYYAELNNNLVYNNGWKSTAGGPSSQIVLGGGSNSNSYINFSIDTNASTVAAGTAASLYSAIYINNAAKVGINNTSPYYNLSMGAYVNDYLFGLYDNATFPYGLGIRGGTWIQYAPTTGGVITFGHMSAYPAGTYTERVRIDNSGYLLVGYTSSVGSYRLQVNGTSYLLNGYTTSDKKYKKNIKSFSKGLEIINSLNPVEFDWIKQSHIMKENGEILREGHNFPEGKNIGFIAQDVQKVLKDKDWLSNIVSENKREAIKDEDGKIVAEEESYLAVSEMKLVPVLVQAIKELTARLEKVEGKK